MYITSKKYFNFLVLVFVLLTRGLVYLLEDQLCNLLAVVIKLIKFNDKNFCFIYFCVLFDLNILTD